MSDYSGLDYNLGEFHDACQKGIEFEIKASYKRLAEAGLHNGLEITSGRQLDSQRANGRQHYYELYYESPLIFEEIPIDLPAGTSCIYEYRNVKAKGRIQEHNTVRRSIIVSLEQAIGTKNFQGKLKFIHTFLLDLLAKQLTRTLRESHHDPDTDENNDSVEDENEEYWDESEDFDDEEYESNIVGNYTLITDDDIDYYEDLERFEYILDHEQITRLLKFLHGSWNEFPEDTLPELPNHLRALELNPAQQLAVRRLLNRDNHVVWGPPGTGKTSTLAASALALLHDEIPKKVGIFTHTNVALDNTIKAIINAWRKINPRGTPHDFGREICLLRKGISTHLTDEELEFLDAPFEALAASNISFLNALKNAEDFLRRQTDFIHKTEHRTLNARAYDVQRRLAILRNERNPNPGGSGAEEFGALEQELYKEFKKIQVKLLKNSHIICATLSSLLVNYHELSSYCSWQYALVDEISMVGIAQLIPVLGLRCQIAGFGDFQQLPPIVISLEPTAKKYLGKHLFDWIDCNDPSVDDERRTMLNTQYRMHPEICHPVSRQFYSKKLLTAPSVNARKSAFTWHTAHLDTAGLDARVETQGKSKNNPVHATLIANLIRSLTAKGIVDIGVITPYSAQAETIRKELKQVMNQHSEIEVSTVHSYQGREKQVIIFDAMVSPGEPLKFLTSINPAIDQMVNVACSRAMDCLITVYSQDSLNDFTSNSTLRTVLSMYSLMMMNPGRILNVERARVDQQLNTFVKNLLK